MIDTRAFGIDTSHYDGPLDWARLIAHMPRVSFIGMRSTISWGYRDPFFTANWKGAKEYDLVRTAYHVVYPGEDAMRQYDNIMAALGNDPGELPVTLDAELHHNLPRATITRTIRQLADIIIARTNRKPILYTRATWADLYLYSDAFDDLQWWLATYLKVPLFSKYANEHPGPPLLPTGISSYLIHQTGDKMPPICSTTTKATQDYDRWNGTEADMLQYVYGSAGIPEEPVVTPIKPLGITFEVLRNMNMRDGPGAEYKDIGDLKAGQIITAENIGGHNSWIEFAPGKWAALEYNGITYLKRVI